MIVKCQARLSSELQSQTQEASSLSVEVDEHAITRKLLVERWGHVRAVGRKVKGIGSSTTSVAISHVNFGAGSSSCPTLSELATRPEAREAQEMVQSMGDSMQCFVATL